MSTIVTGFWDIGRDNWNNKYKRDVSYYLNNGKKVLSVTNNMVIFIDPKFETFVKEQRKGKESNTLIIPMEFDELYMNKFPKLKDVINDDNWKKSLRKQDNPITNIKYITITLSKLSLVKKAIELNPFNSTHFCWLDYGCSFIPDNFVNKQIFNNIPDKIKFLKLSNFPKNIPYYYEDRLNWYKFLFQKIGGTVFTGSIEYFKLFNTEFENEVKYCLDNNTIAQEESIFYTVTVKNPDLFTFYEGYWHEIISKYDS